MVEFARDAGITLGKIAEDSIPNDDDKVQIAILKILQTIRYQTVTLLKGRDEELLAARKEVEAAAKKAVEAIESFEKAVMAEAIEKREE